MARDFTLMSRRSGAVQLRIAADHRIFDRAEECDAEHRTGFIGLKVRMRTETCKENGLSAEAHCERMLNS